MPDVTFAVEDISDADDAAKLERALSRVQSVSLVNVDPKKGLVAVSFEGGEAEQKRIEEAIGEAGHEFERPPGADAAGG